MDHSASAASRRTQEDNSVFLAQNDQMQKLEWLSILELAAVILLGTYQYVRLKDIISSSNN